MSWGHWTLAFALCVAGACIGDEPAGTAPPSTAEAGASSSGGGASDASGSSGGPDLDAAVDAEVDDGCDPDAPFVRTTLVPGLEAVTVSDRMTLTADELQLFYSQDLTRDLPYGQVYSTSRSSRTEPFATPPTLREDLSSPSQDYNPAISPDGKRLVLVSSRGDGRYSLYLATREDPLGAFGALTRLDIGIGSATTGYASSIIGVDGTLYFARRTAPANEYDQFRSALAGGTYLGAAAVSHFKTAFSETDLVLASDARHAFFTSDRPLPGGDADAAPGAWHIWQATRGTASEPWSAPVPLVVDGLDLTAETAFVGHVSVDGCRLYFETGAYPNGRARIAFRGR